MTETGDEVILYEDGKWSYIDNGLNNLEVISTNKKKYKKEASSSFIVKSNKVNVGVWINPKEWKFEKEDSEAAAEYTFTSNDEGIYGMLITEKIEIPIQNLRQAAINNAKSVAPDTKVINQEYRTVNDNEVLMMQLIGTIQGVKFVYYGYYFTSSYGTVQLVTYTSENLFKTREGEMEMFLNGLVGLSK